MSELSCADEDHPLKLETLPKPDTDAGVEGNYTCTYVDILHEFLLAQEKVYDKNNGKTAANWKIID